MWFESGWAIKLTGAKIGALASFALMPPKNIRDALSRASFSIGAGYFFASDVQSYFGMEGLRSAAILTALLSWFVATFTITLLTKLDVANIIALLKEFRK